MLLMLMLLMLMLMLMITIMITAAAAMIVMAVGNVGGDVPPPLKRPGGLAPGRPSPNAGGCGAVRLRGRPGCERGGFFRPAPGAALPVQQRDAPQGGRAAPFLNP